VKRTCLASLLLAALGAAAHAQEDGSAAPPSRLQLSGYIQARYVLDERSTTAEVVDGFIIRRGRLKATYDAEWSKYVLQLDAVPREVTLRDAEVHLIEPWTGQSLALVLGQQKWPFGFQVVQSSSQRLFPERTRVIRAFFASERDRGAKVVASLGAFRFTGGLFDGSGIDGGTFRDTDRHKDVVGRAGFDFGWLCGGVSGWYGRAYRAQATEPIPVEAAWFDRHRLGADLQLAASPLAVGKTYLQAELVGGRGYWRAGQEQFGVPALGWYAELGQWLGGKNLVAVRYDHFDPSTAVPDAAAGGDPTRPSTTNQVGTVGLALAHQWNEVLKLTAAVEVPMTRGPPQVADPDDNSFTLQMQAKF
jgi:hypothetical protein